VKGAWSTYKKSLAVSTRAGYSTGWRSFCEWAEAFSTPSQRISVINPSEQSLILWLQYQTQFIQPDSAIKYLYGVRDMNVNITGRNILSRKPRVRKMIRALRKSGPKREPKWKGITSAVLRQVLPFVDFSDHDQRCAWAMSTTGTYTLQRIGEFAPQKGKRARYPLGGNTQMYSTHGVTFLPQSKTDVNNEGVSLVWPRTGTPTCPWQATAEYRTRSVVQLTKSGPAWLRSNGEPADRDWLISTFRHWAAQAGLEPLDYNGVSYRRGGAQTLAYGGVSDRVIQAIGRWKSQCFKRYVGMLSREVLDANRRMSELEGEPVNALNEVSFDVRAWCRA
jgi:hypothetical protein